MMAYELLVGLKPDVTALRMSADAIAAEDARAQINSPSSPIDGTSKKARLAQKMAFLLPFPQRVSGAARDFVLCALRPLPHERLTAQQLLQHDWIGPWIEEPMRTEEGDEEDWP